MKHELIPLGDKLRWQAALDGIRHGFGHTWESVWAFSQSTSHQAVLYTCDAVSTRVVCPLLIRPFEDRFDVATPFGFSGFAGTGNCPGFGEAWLEFGRRMNWICAYIAQNPILDGGRYWETEAFERAQELHWLDLGPDEDTLSRRLSRGKRRSIAEWRQEPGWLCDDPLQVSAFVRKEAEGFFGRIGAAPSYRQSPETLAYLAKCANVEAIGAIADGRMVAATLFGASGNLADALFNISLPEGRGAASALMWEGAMRLKSRGVHFLNMGGGVREGDRIEESKRGFHGFTTPLMRLKLVFDPGRYAGACRAAGADPSNRSGYFPAYRRP